MISQGLPLLDTLEVVNALDSTLLMIVLIVLNIIIVNLYKMNPYFPVIFMLFEIVFGISVIMDNELFITILMVFGVVYNLFLMEYHLSLRKVKKNV